MKFESDLNTLNKITNDRWDELTPILQYCTKENEYVYSDKEIQLTIMYEELLLPLPIGHPSSRQMIFDRIQDIRREAFNYLRMHVNGEGEDSLNKAIELTENYNKAMELYFKDMTSK